MSIAAIIATTTYFIVAAMCLRAARQPIRRRDGTSPKGVWRTASIAFIMMAIFRILELEDRLRGLLRVQLRSNGLYDTRRDIQVWLAIGLLVAAITVAAFAYKTRPRNTRDHRSVAIWIVRWSLAGFATLILLRITSFTIADRILFGGPIHINWLLDGGLTLAVALAAYVYSKRDGTRNAK